MPAAEPIDAIPLLKADHRQVEGLFEKLDKTRGADRQKAPSAITPWKRSTLVVEQE